MITDVYKYAYRKVVENNGGDESSSDGSGRGDTPPRELKSAGNKTEKTLRERIVCALSPESLRKRDNQESSPKKKKSNFSPGTSPNNTSQLIKRSKIEEDEVDCVLEEKEINALVTFVLFDIFSNYRQVGMPILVMSFDSFCTRVGIL